MAPGPDVSEAGTTLAALTSDIRRTMAGRPWTPTQVETLKAMALSGYTAAEIGRKLRRTAPAISTRVQLEGIALTRKNRFSAAKPRRLRQRRR